MGRKRPAAKQHPAGAAIVRRPRTPFLRRPILEELESRLLMSADPLPAALIGDTVAATPFAAEYRAITDVGAPTIEFTAVQPEAVHKTHEIVFVDASAPDFKTLVDDIRANASDTRDIEVVALYGGGDGIAQITGILAKRSDIDAIHIVSHGSPGEVQLGTATLDFDSLVKQSKAIKAWGKALGENGDILFYGCDLAANESGKSLMQAIARLTGADVAASEDLTGAAALGGDWDLEYKVGAVEAQVAVSAAEQQAFVGVLQAAAVGTETRANTTTLNAQTIEQSASKQVAVAGDGSYVVTWVSQNQDGSGMGVYARRFSAAGAALTGEVLINQTTANDQRNPAVATDVNGNFVVMWDSFNGTDFDVYARRFDAAGTALGNEFQVNTTSAGNQEQGGIAMAPDGRFAIGWASVGQDGSGAGAYVRFYNAAGVAITGEVRVNTTTSGNQYFDSIAMDASGNVIVVGTGDYIDSAGQGVFGQRFDATGTGDRRQLHGQHEHRGRPVVRVGRRRGRRPLRRHVHRLQRERRGHLLPALQRRRHRRRREHAGQRGQREQPGVLERRRGHERQFRRHLVELQPGRRRHLRRLQARLLLERHRGGRRGARERDHRRRAGAIVDRHERVGRVRGRVGRQRHRRRRRRVLPALRGQPDRRHGERRRGRHHDQHRHAPRRARARTDSSPCAKRSPRPTRVRSIRRRPIASTSASAGRPQRA